MSDLTDLKVVIINMLKELKGTVIKAKEKQRNKKHDGNVMPNRQHQKRDKIIKKNFMEILELKSTY